MGEDRLTDLREEFIACKSSKEVQLQQLHENDRIIFDKIDSVDKKVEGVDKTISNMSGRITAGVAGALLLMEVVFKFILK